MIIICNENDVMLFMKVIPMTSVVIMVLVITITITINTLFSFTSMICSLFLVTQSLKSKIKLENGFTSLVLGKSL